MGKKIVLINGSFRKRNTWNILRQIEQLLNNRGHSTEIINLSGCTIADCTGCEICVSACGCVQKDDMDSLMEKIRNSDAVVFGSPVYLLSVSSLFKTFADRTNAWMHKPETTGKPILCAATTTVTGARETGQFFRSYAKGLGARIGGYVARTAKDINKPVTEKEISRFLSLLEEDRKYYAPVADEIIMFTVQKVLAGKSNDDNNRFWTEKGWLDKNYYYPCRMNPGKKLFGKFMFKVISKAMRR